MIQRCPICGSFYRQDQVCYRDGSALEPSDGVVDRYQVVDRLGVGGMGTVYKAMHTLLDNRIVAIKLLHRELSQNPEVVNRFFREAKAASRAENKHIVEVVDFGVTPDGDSFLVMEYLEGPSLRDVLEDEAQMSLSVALRIAVQIAEGLYAAHRRGIIHRDLKPENVVLVKQGDSNRFVKLLDFGIAKLTEQQATNLTVAGMVVGTPTYMSPEQAGGETVDHRTDIYALGTILYEMLTGQPPFTADTTKQLLMAQLTQSPTAPRELRQEIPATVEAVILHTLEKDRERRPETMYHLACELRDALKGQSPAVSPSPLDAMMEGGAGDPLEPTLDLPLAVNPLRRFLPLIGLGAGLFLGIGITVALMSGGGEESPADAGTAAAKVAKNATPDQSVEVRPDQKVVASSPAPDATVVAVKTPTRPTHKRPGHKRRIRRHVTRHKPAPKKKPALGEPKSKYKANVVSSPNGAKVFEGNRLLGRTPLKIDTGRARRLTVHLPGLEAKTLVLPKHSTARFNVKLAMATMSWEVRSLSKLKRMMDQGKISRFTYKRRRAKLIKKRDSNIMKLGIKLKLGHITEAQYHRAVQAEKDIYK